MYSLIIKDKTQLNVQPKQLSVHAVIQATRKEHFHSTVSAVRPE